MKKIFDYLQGTIRYKLYYIKGGLFRFLIRKHIIEQFEWRLTVMDKDCYNIGECKICGCNTTALQFADKACDKPCYPIMTNRKMWKIIKELLCKQK